VTPSQPTLNNPYLPDATDDNVGAAPFVGRQRGFEHIYQRLAEPQGAGVSVVLGRHDIGKTAFLKHFHDYFDDSFISAYLPLKTVSPQNEAEWLTTLALETMHALAQRDFSMYRLPKPDNSYRELRDWLVDNYLVEVFGLIRYRRLVWLLDDGDRLLEWIRSGKLPGDSVAYLYQVRQRLPGLGLVLTLDERFETRIPSLSPLAELTDVIRLTNLNAEEATALMQQPVEGLYRIENDVAEAVYRLSGGAPRLIQRFGSQFYQRWEASPKPFTAEDAGTIGRVVYGQSKTDFQHLWSSLEAGEQRIIAAMAELVYADPLSPIDARHLERWLIDTDHPMDMTAVHAALRGLEYRQIIESNRGSIRFTAQLLQMWFIENARFQKIGQAASADTRTRRLWQPLALIAVLVILLVLLVVISSQQRAGEPSANLPLQPTVTLVGGS
jgi:hypothetical protein